MKRFGHLFEQVYTFPALYQAFKKARKGSGKYLESMDYTFHLEKNLLALSESLKAETYQPAPYRYFYIHDPKTRRISVASFEDRIVHHAVVGALEPIYERSFIYDSYATRKDKGTHKALQRAQQFLRKNTWYYKTDIQQYFASIDHAMLLSLIRKKIKDARLIRLIEKITANGGDHGKGLPIGNLTSQFFANVYLNPLDHFIKHELGCRYYVRYMDDWVIFHEDKERLKALHKALKAYLHTELGLHLNPNATYFNQRLHGLPFLGARIFRATIRMKRENKRRIFKRIHRRIKEFNLGALEDETFLASMNSYWAYLEGFDSYHLRSEFLKGQQVPTGSNRVLRGGSWNNNASTMRVFNRNNNNPNNRNNNNGFRPSNTEALPDL